MSFLSKLRAKGTASSIMNGVKLNRAAGKVGGTWKHFYSRQNQNYSFENFYSRMIIDEQLSKQVIKKFTQLSLQLRSFNPSYLKKVDSSLKDNPDQYSKVVTEIFEIYIQDLTQLHELFPRVVAAITDLFKMVNKLDILIYTQAGNIIEGAYKKAKLTKFVAMPSSIRETKTELKKVIEKQKAKYRKLMNKVASEEDEIAKTKITKKNKLGFFFFNRFGSITKKLARNDLGQLERYSVILNNQIKNGFKVDLFPYLVAYFKVIDHTEKIEAEMRKDIEKLRDAIVQDVLETKVAISQFIALYQNHELAVALKPKIKEAKKMNEEIKMSVVDTKKNYAELYEAVQRFEDTYLEMLEGIAKISENKLEKLKNAEYADEYLDRYARGKFA